MNQSSPDVATILAQLRVAVRATHTQPDTLKHAVRYGIDPDDLRAAVADLESLRAVSAHWPLSWRTPRQRALVFVQRVIRRALRWYIQPIVAQQNAFNNAVTHAVSLLVESQTQLMQDAARLAASHPETSGEAHATPAQ